MTYHVLTVTVQGGRVRGAIPLSTALVLATQSRKIRYSASGDDEP
jgi:hypothetical protein